MGWKGGGINMWSMTKIQPLPIWTLLVGPVRSKTVSLCGMDGLTKDQPPLGPQSVHLIRPKWPPENYNLPKKEVGSHTFAMYIHICEYVLLIESE